jgi:hypothetical protein
MKDVTSAKGLSDLRTATTHHVASKPPRKGTTYLDLYSLSMEKQRLEKELSRLEQRKKRIHERLEEVQRVMGKLERAAQVSSAKPGTDQQTASGEQPKGRQWKKMAVDY